MRTLVLLVCGAALMVADEGNLAVNNLRIDQILTVSPGSAIQMLRTSSTSVEQIQWCLSGGTCDPTAVGGWALGPDGTNGMTIQAGVGSSTLLTVFHLDSSGSLTIPSIFSAGTVNASGTISAAGHVNSVNGYDLNGTIMIDNMGNATFPGTLVASGISSLGVISSTGNITAASGAYIKSTGGFFEGSTQFLDTSRNLINIVNLTASGTTSLGSNAFFIGDNSLIGSTSHGFLRADASGNVVLNAASAGNLYLGFDQGQHIYFGVGGGGMDLTSTSLSIYQSVYMTGTLTAAGLGVYGVTGSDLNVAFVSPSGHSATLLIGPSGNTGNPSFISDSSGNFILQHQGIANVFSSTAAGAVNGTLSLSAGNAAVYGNVSAGGNVTANGMIGAVSGYQLNGSTIVDSSGNATFPGSLGAHGITSIGGMSASGNITTSAGYFNSLSGYEEGGTQFLDTSRDLINIVNITASGTVSGGSLYVGSTLIVDGSGNGTFPGTLHSSSGITSSGIVTATGNITSSGGFVKSFGGFYEGSTQILDTSFDLVNIVNFVSSGQMTLNGAFTTTLFIPNGGVSVGGNVTLTAGSLSVTSGSFSSLLNISTNSGSFVARGSVGQSCSGSPSSSFASVGGIVTHC